MASQARPASNIPVSAAVDPAFWTQDLSDSSPLALQLSPGASSTTQDSVHSVTPPAQTPRSDSGKTGQSAQNSQNASQTRTSVAVACVPCRSRHLKCDGGVRCSRCRADGVECTYIKSRRGWKGKRKKPGENGAPTVTLPGSLLPQPSPGLCSNIPYRQQRPASELTDKFCFAFYQQWNPIARICVQHRPCRCKSAEHCRQQSRPCRICRASRPAQPQWNPKSQPVWARRTTHSYSGLLSLLLQLASVLSTPS